MDKLEKKRLIMKLTLRLARNIARAAKVVIVFLDTSNPLEYRRKAFWLFLQINLRAATLDSYIRTLRSQPIFPAGGLVQGERVEVNLLPGENIINREGSP